MPGVGGVLLVQFLQRLLHLHGDKMVSGQPTEILTGNILYPMSVFYGRDTTRDPGTTNERSAFVYSFTSHNGGRPVSETIIPSQESSIAPSMITNI